MKIVGILIFWFISIVPHGATAQSTHLAVIASHTLACSPSDLICNSDRSPDGASACDLFGNALFDEEDNVDGDFLDTGHLLVSQDLIGGNEVWRLDLRRSRAESHPPHITPLRC